MKTVIFALAVAGASAFAPIQAPAASTALFMEYGQFDGQMWDQANKNQIYAVWNPAAPRSPSNFNPYETWEGNSPDASGFYPGENRYKDPMRGDVSFQSMMVEREENDARTANPKAGSAPGCAGCRT